jgi:hypothetical protein
MRDASGRLIMTSLTPDNEETLAKIASITGGKYVKAEEGTVGMGPIRAELGKLQASERKSRRITVHEDRYALVLLLAFLLIVLDGILPEAWLATPARRHG